jgi:hypothetical protein
MKSLAIAAGNVIHCIILDGERDAADARTHFWLLASYF